VLKNSIPDDFYAWIIQVTHATQTVAELRLFLETLSDDAKQFINARSAGATLLQLALEGGNKEWISNLLLLGANPKKLCYTQLTMTPITSLGYSIYMASIFKPEDFLQILELLIKAGADVNELDKNDATLLHYYPWGAFLASTIHDPNDLVKFLITHGARLDIRNPLGNTALELNPKLSQWLPKPITPHFERATERKVEEVSSSNIACLPGI
jgi:ankyrin repeat protein